MVIVFFFFHYSKYSGFSLSSLSAAARSSLLVHLLLRVFSKMFCFGFKTVKRDDVVVRSGRNPPAGSGDET